MEDSIGFNTTDELKNALNQLLEAYQILLGENATLKNQVETTGSENSNLKQTIEKLETDKKNLQEEVDTNKKFINEMQTTKKEQNKELDGMLGKIRNLLETDANSIKSVSKEFKEEKSFEDIKLAPTKEEKNTQISDEDRSEFDLFSDNAKPDKTQQQNTKKEESTASDEYMGNKGSIDLNRMQSLLGGFGKK